ncbi:ArsR/SmtB family transcription factor [Synechococcus sp. BS55D]|uniref:ArsR/SmtB family transcription factor n=1 Tax=Synechococcus sp. BS55D TaxID=2055943 RepID=UPI00103EEB09|nr:metalloregulator ArsR/SmtB family transcription factor [Synechococcus sp. BS55D]TCD57308.1 transcriptional regulator [Synechococcus sp. BS55D]
MSPALEHPSSLGSDQARGLLKALADPLRLKIIEALSGGERCVCDLTAELALSQSRLSFHLKVLRECGLLEDRQEGRWVYYSLRPDRINALRAWLALLEQNCQTPARQCCD